MGILGWSAMTKDDTVEIGISSTHSQSKTCGVQAENTATAVLLHFPENSLEGSP